MNTNFQDLEISLIESKSFIKLHITNERLELFHDHEGLTIGIKNNNSKTHLPLSITTLEFTLKYLKGQVVQVASLVGERSWVACPIGKELGWLSNNSTIESAQTIGSRENGLPLSSTKMSNIG